mmetsp:Transcript_27752/g.85144  ORF Transcript_27752/g.85144 Transcript_27752/m.85144 type:complete len:260 (-) Transcript_27752:330-1109(-)
MLGVLESSRRSTSEAGPGATTCRRAVHWPACSMRAESRAAAAKAPTSSAASEHSTMVLGPPQLENVLRTSSLTAIAARREPVRYAAMSSQSSASTRRCTDRSQHRKFTSFFESSSSSSLSSWAQRKQCWPTVARDAIRTGTPHSTFRRTLRDRSRKLEKFWTQNTRTGLRSIVRRPRRSSSRSWSLSERSTGRTRIASSISVTPSCLWKSRAWFATNCGASAPSGSNRRSSAERTASSVASRFLARNVLLSATMALTSS